MARRVEIFKTVFTQQSAQATLHIEEDGSAKLTNVYSQVRGQGHASLLLQEVIDFADEHGLILWLEVQRYGEPRGGLDNKQLTDLYSKFGFTLCDESKRPVMMIRKPLLKGENT